MSAAVTTLIGAIISGLVALIVAGIQHSKTSALMGYRLDALEKKMDKYNSVQERMIVVERDLKAAFYRIDEMRGGMHENRKV